MKGMEQMIASMLGINPAELKQQAETFLKFVAGKAQQIEAHMADMKTSQLRMEERLAIMDAKMNAIVEDMGFDEEHDAALPEPTVNGAGHS